MKYIGRVCLIIFILTSNCMALPPGFVYLKDYVPDVIQDVRYHSHHNFVGTPIRGYEASTCIITKEAALALKGIQDQLRDRSMGLKIFDCYRPQTAVDHFIAWSEDPVDQKMKHEYYPRIDKPDLFRLGYLAMRSGHSRGSTVDLTIVEYDNKHQYQELAMGTPFDYLDVTSHPLSDAIDGEAKHNRLFLRHLMLEAGFHPLSTEWWHFTLADEPFPHTYFDFPVK